jgi:predicted Fe-S protein YdhL (DUF1289 family)
MALFPKIQSPCPYKSQIASLMDGDMCRMCKRQVVDLTHMTDGERVAFMKGCAGEVCVSYRFPMRPMLAAAVVAAAISAPVAAAACDATTEVVVSMGGIKDLANVQYVQNPGDGAIPELPVVYENTSAKQSVPANPSSNAMATASISSRPAS